MPLYQVSLYKDLLSSDGHPFHCLQAVVDVEADAPEGAVRLALDGVPGGVRDWSVEVEERPRSVGHVPTRNGTPAELA